MSSNSKNKEENQKKEEQKEEGGMFSLLWNIVKTLFSSPATKYVGGSAISGVAVKGIVDPNNQPKPNYNPKIEKIGNDDQLYDY